MSNKENFYENQKVRQWWIWLIVVTINILFIFGFVQQIILGQPLGDKPIDNTILILLTILVFFFFLLLSTCSLKTRITKKWIYIKYFPFHWVYKSYKRDNINKIEVIKYDPIREFGGWGIRTGFFRKRMVYNISGKQGILLEFENGKKIIIGTRKAKEISKILKKP